MLHCDEGQMLELSALKLFMLANLHQLHYINYQLC